MIKLIHTSDWHLGHTLYNYDRSEEQTDFLQQLCTIITQEQPHVLLVCGDIYHTSTPSASVQRLYTESMLAIHQSCPHMQIIVIGGNHDSSAKLEIDSSLWKHFNVTVIGSIYRNSLGETDWNRHIVPIIGRDGKVCAYIAAVPHTYPQNLPIPANDMLPKEERQKIFFQTLLEKVAAMNTENLPVILAAHLTVSSQKDFQYKDHVIGGIESINLKDFGSGFDYLALGHIHCPYHIQTENRIAAYCGSPIAVDFDEDYPHYVSSVEIKNRMSLPVLKQIPVRNLHPLTTIPSEPKQLQEALLELEHFAKDRKDYIRLQVIADSSVTPNVLEQINLCMQEKAGRFCYLKVLKPEKDTTSKHKEVSIEDLKEKSPTDIACLYFEEKEGIPMDSELKLLMQQAWQSVLQDGKETE